MNFVLFRIIRKACFYCVFCFSRLIQFVLLYNKKAKELSTVYRSKQKRLTRDQVLLSYREHPRELLCCSAPTFMLFHSSLFLKFVSTLDSRLFEPALVRTSRLFEPFFIPRGYSLITSTKNLSVIRTFSSSNFRLFEPIYEPS